MTDFKTKLDQAIRLARQDMDRYAERTAEICEARFYRVLEAFRAEHVSTTHFATSSGYGYNDAGRDKLEALYSRVFSTEAALMRLQIVSGSHAISLALFGNLLPGDELLCLGLPYDTLQTVIGLKRNVPCSLKEMGVSCRVLDVDFSALEADAIVAAVKPQTRMVAIQRSRGYSLRPSLHVAEIDRIAAAIKQRYPEVIIFVDNCYGEFVEMTEPGEDVDLIAGSLIKNPGAGIASGGGYICGREQFVERAACRLTVPGAGREMGATLADGRPFFQSLLLAPQIVQEALLGAVFAASLLEQLGFQVSPGTNEERADIIQTICMETPQRLIAFCRGIQRYSPVDSFVMPEPWPMPGYDNDIIMASGGFVAGSSIELSADAPLREPYLAFLQGGLSRYHTIYAVSQTLQDMAEAGLLKSL